MNIYRVEVKFLSSLRDSISSYTIFGGICWAYRLLYSEDSLLKFLNRYIENPSFIVSSILPKKEGKNFFPKPLLLSERSKVLDDYKKLKKLNFISEENFKKVLDGKIKTEQDLVDELKNQKEPVDLYTKTLQPKTKIDRIFSSTEGDGELFYQEHYYYTDSFFYILFYNESLKNEVFSSLKLLQDCGIGGDRTSGGGKVLFSDPVSDDSLKKYIENKTDRFITLSPFIVDTDIFYEDSFYEYYTFTGAVDNNYDFKLTNIWKDKLIYLKEGSNLKVKSRKDVYGEIRKIDLVKTVYQYGLAFPVYIQSGG
ncbi:type III-A CRISPR-associated RAMP protein Csm4 [Sulfurihydrogenibium sp.]|uniref:type III-A CRISPR-associated RAMP protein Csm4 n=1 Tax=Sulfurihydrogenibium sp. TaxID=2053621 RepID=UPI00262A7DD4|nr:type III-A CRISPR-associated RAMP protein Csm4 [Sulfurihydrogenibium sp.]